MMKLPGTRDDERFFFSRWIPRPWVLLNLGLVKCSFWGPWPFVSLAFPFPFFWAWPFWSRDCGWWFGGTGPKVRALQMYFGIKADGTQSIKYQGPIMVLTLKELAAFRVHNVDVNDEWLNMGGS